MISNGNDLRQRSPILEMIPDKIKFNGVSHGLGEAGYDIRIRQDVILHPFSRFRLASTMEQFYMPDNLVAIVHDKSTWARRGLSVFNTVIEPGWHGTLTLELIYHRYWPLRIKAGTGIAQVIFHQLTEPARYEGKYQGQVSTPVKAIFERI